MGQLKVKVIHASVTQKMLSRMQQGNVHDLAHLAQHFVNDGACFTLTFNCPIQISKFFHKTSTVTCPLPANLIKSVDIEKKFSVDKNVIWAFEGTDYNGSN